MTAMLRVDEVTSLVGRDPELERLQGALDRARRREPSTVLVSGDAGVGKTRLVHEFGALADASGARVLSGACVEFGEDGRPYAPFVSIVRGLVRSVGPARVLEWAGSGSDALATFAPELSPGTEDVGLRAANPMRVQYAVTNLIVSCARTQPVVLVLEDLHWADRSTRSFLPELLHDLRDAAVVTILTMRSDELTTGSELGRILAELVRGSGGLRLHVPSLTREEQARQLAQLQAHPVDDDFVDRVYARARGNPFFAEELVAAGLDGNLPDGLRYVLLHRVVSLPRASRDILRVVAVAGEDCPDWLVARAVGIDVESVDDALRPAVAAHVLVPAADGGYRFRHPLLREATLQTLLSGERRRLHRALAVALAASGAANVATDLAHHWREAGDTRRALPACLEAARVEVALGAYPDALAHYEQALRLWRVVPEAADLAGGPRHAILVEAGEVALRYGEYAAGGAFITQALDEVDTDADPATASTYHALLGEAGRLMVDGAASQVAYERAVELAPADDVAVRAGALSGLARCRMTMDRHEEAIELATLGRDLAHEANLGTVEAHCLLTLGASQTFIGQPAVGLESVWAGQRVAISSGDEAATIRSFVNLTALMSELGQLAEVPALVEQAGEAVGPLGQRNANWKCLAANAVEALIHLGRWEELREQLADVNQPDPNGLENLEAMGLLARLDMEQGRLDAAAAGIAKACDWVVATGEPQLIAPVFATATELACWEQDGPRALHVAETGLEHMGGTTSHLGLGLIAAAIRGADVWARSTRDAEEKATALAAGRRWMALARTAAEGPTSAFPPVRAHLKRAEAELASLEGEPSADLWDASATAWEAMEHPSLVAYCRWRQAEAVLAGGGDRDEAVRILRDAHSRADGIGALTVDREIQRLARRVRLRLGADSPETVDVAGTGLTEREHEILTLVASGLTNAGIAEQLFISPRTVSTHVSNILGKVGATTRTEAAAMLHAAAATEGAEGRAQEPST